MTPVEWQWGWLGQGRGAGVVGKLGGWVGWEGAAAAAPRGCEGWWVGPPTVLCPPEPHGCTVISLQYTVCWKLVCAQKGNNGYTTSGLAVLRVSCSNPLLRQLGC